MTGDEQICFVIAPIGSRGSPDRERADKVLRYIIEPAALECGYRAVRADKISEPGMITRQVITHVIDAPMVIADLTGPNPNVFYELAIRHAIGKPVVKLIEAGESIPFDVGQSRTIFLDHRDLASADACRQELVRQMRAAKESPYDADNPITEAITLKGLLESGDPNVRLNAEIASMLKELLVRVGRLESSERSYELPESHQSSRRRREAAEQLTKKLIEMRLAPQEFISKQAEMMMAYVDKMRLEGRPISDWSAGIFADVEGLWDVYSHYNTASDVALPSNDVTEDAT